MTLYNISKSYTNQINKSLLIKHIFVKTKHIKMRRDIDELFVSSEHSAKIVLRGYDVSPAIGYVEKCTHLGNTLCSIHIGFDVNSERERDNFELLLDQINFNK